MTNTGGIYTNGSQGRLDTPGHTWSGVAQKTTKTRHKDYTI